MPTDNLNIVVSAPHVPDMFERVAAMSGVNLIRYEEPTAGLPEPQEWDADVLAKADVLFCLGYCPANIDQARKLKWVQLSSAGYETFLPFNLPRRGVRASNALGVFDVPIGEWNLMMMIALARDLRGMIRNQDQARWDPADRFQREIRGSVVGFWGYGGIARETARLAKAMDMKVHVLVRSTTPDGRVKPRRDVYCVPGTGDPEGKLPDRVFTMDRKVEFLKSLDFLIVAMPLTDVSRGAIGEAELRALPLHAFVLNPARGPIIQEQALLKALREKWFAGAALDTHYAYPLPPEHPLWSMPNALLTPHISGSSGSQHYPRRVWDIFTQNLDRFRTGRPLLNELTPAQLTGA